VAQEDATDVLHKIDRLS